MKIKIMSYQLAASFNIRKIRKEFRADLLEGNSFELFYRTRKDMYLLILDYGVAVLAGYDPLETSKILTYLKMFAKNPVEEQLTEDLIVQSGAGRASWNFDTLKVPVISQPVIKLAMLNVGQSVGLDYYSSISQALLDETTVFYEALEKKGHLTISRRNLFKFIGKAMNIRKNIIDNIYILNEPDVTWEDEGLNKIYSGLQDVFDIKTRFRELDYQQQIELDNLRMLTELYQHEESNRLEIIIIALILFEVLHLIATEILKRL